ncbi:MAG: dehypoxanthine futalosine cyclase [Chloroflexi bacterium]|nr:dehypoxanthine futalosine cyclase [Chloroflexota bacterium]MDL1883104.1 dehypoxanthine futalosine cyclase [Anaerolineae bacterium CFX8]
MNDTQAQIQNILARVHEGGRITYDEGLLLYQHADLLDLADAANARRQQLVPGDLVTYLIDRNINYTNVCVTDCQFCNFYALPGDKQKGYVNSKHVLGKKIEEALALGATRILMQGGHNPDLPLEYYLDLVDWIHRTYPTIEINAFSPSEIQYIGEISGLSWREVLSRLKAVGLQGLPGGGGEILDDEIRKRVSPKKIMTDDWFGVMKVAHELGLVTTATMVIGFREDLRHRMNHLKRLRDEQDDSLLRFGGGFNAFISWSVQIENTPLARSRFASEYGATSTEYLRHTAIARIFLDNIPHVSASWPTQGAKVGQMALHFGCDDFGSTMIEENVVSAAGAVTKISPVMLPREIHRQIRQAGFIPAQRNTNYDVLKVFEKPEDDDDLQSIEAISAAAASQGSWAELTLIE